MIPPILHLRWAGEKPSWLRLQTAVSWQRHAPQCEVNFERVAGHDTPAHEADIWRWRQLYERGGWWSDLDVIYYADVRPLAQGKHQLWLTTDGNADQPYSIGLMAAPPCSPIVKELWRLAEKADRSDYQACGVRVLHKLWGMAPPPEVGCIPHRAIYPTPSVSHMMAAMWSHYPDAWMPSHGLHWFGGFSESKVREHDAPDKLFNALHAIGKALRRSEGKR